MMPAALGVNTDTNICVECGIILSDWENLFIYLFIYSFNLKRKTFMIDFNALIT